MSDFEVKAYPELWQSLDMDVERFDKARQMLGDVYAQAFLSQEKAAFPLPLTEREHV